MSEFSRTLLAGDIGGTKTFLALAHIQDTRVQVLREARYDTADYASLTPMVQDFLAGVVPDAAGFGLATPVSERQVKLTNLDFWIDADDIVQRTGIASVRLLNDFAAIAYGLDLLQAEDVMALQTGRVQAKTPRVLLGAGTGLGVAMLAWCGEHYQILSSEGGHMDFAPVGGEQLGLLNFLSARHGHVSYERILSGAGLHAIYDYLISSQSTLATPLALTAQEDMPAAISHAGLSGEDACAAQALTLFVQIYGQYAGNLALLAQPEAGIYLAGGIAPKIIARLQQPDFLEAFRAKGRYRAWLSQLPVYVVMNPKVGLLGALLAASR